MKRTALGFLAILAPNLLGGPQAADAQPGPSATGGVEVLRDIRDICVEASIRGTDPPRPAPPGITERQMEDLVVVFIRSNMPRLAMKADCPAEAKLRLSVAFYELSGGITGWAGVISLELQRVVRVNRTGVLMFATLQNRGAILIGNSETVPRQVSELTRELLVEFAADYYRAGNP